MMCAGRFTYCVGPRNHIWSLHTDGLLKTLKITQGVAKSMRNMWNGQLSTTTSKTIFGEIFLKILLICFIYLELTYLEEFEETLKNWRKLFIWPRKKYCFFFCNGLKKKWVGRSVKKIFCIIFLVKIVCFMHVLRWFGVGRAKKT